MSNDLDLIADVRAGLPAMRARAGTYLPRYEAEGESEWRRRVSAAPWRPEFADVLRTLASKPFTRAVGLAAETPLPILEFADDVDACGNNLHCFARKLFNEALADGVALLLVDHPPAPGIRTVAEEKAAGLRPHWSLYPAASIVALYTEMCGGQRVIVHLRLAETATVRDGWKEKSARRIRVLEPGRWELWEEQENQAGKKEFVQIDGGEMRNAAGLLTEVPAVPLFTGERLGDLQTRPPLRDLADMQVELYRALSRQEEVLTYAGSPMLSASGVTAPEVGTVRVGPKTLLYAPPAADGRAAGSWSYVQPDAANLREIREHVESIIEDMQRLGMAPTIDRSGDVSATEFGLTTAKAHSALESWALALKDALEQAFKFTTAWLGHDERRAIGNYEVAVDVHHDFSADVAVTTEAQILLAAEKAKVISKPTTRDELARRGLLGPDFDPKEEELRLAAE